MFGHQTMFDGVCLLNISRMDWVSLVAKAMIINFIPRSAVLSVALLRLVFTSDGVGVGVVIRSVE